MTDFYGNVDKYLPTVPTDTNLNFYGRVDNFLNQDTSFFGNVNNFLYWDKQFPVPVTYSSVSGVFLNFNTPVTGGSWDGTNFTATSPTLRTIYNVSDVFVSALPNADGETDVTDNYISGATDWVIGRSNLTIIKYTTRTATKLSSQSVAAITSDPTGLYVDSPFAYISSGTDSKVYKTNLATSVIDDSLDVDVTDCNGVIFISAFNEIWVSGFDSFGDGVIVGYDRDSKKEIGRFFALNVSNPISGLTYVDPFIWATTSTGRFQKFARDP